MAVAFAVWKVMVERSLEKIVLGAGEEAGASRPLSVQRALSDSDRDSGDETEKKGKKERKIRSNQRDKSTELWGRRV